MSLLSLHFSNPLHTVTFGASSVLSLTCLRDGKCIAGCGKNGSRVDTISLILKFTFIGIISLKMFEYEDKLCTYNEQGLYRMSLICTRSFQPCSICISLVPRYLDLQKGSVFNCFIKIFMLVGLLMLSTATSCSVRWALGSKEESWWHCEFLFPEEHKTTQAAGGSGVPSYPTPTSVLIR